MNKLKPCPFCGKEPDTYDIKTASDKPLPMCRCHTGMCAIYAIPISRERWNTRTPIDRKGLAEVIDSFLAGKQSMGIGYGGYGEEEDVKNLSDKISDWIEQKHGGGE